MRTINKLVTMCFLISLGYASSTYGMEVGSSVAGEGSFPSRIITDKPRLIVLPLKPQRGYAYDGTGLAVQFLLGNVVALHPGLKEFWFGWRIDKIFPQKEDFSNYCRGSGPLLDPVGLGEAQKIRHWLQGWVQPQNSNIKVLLTLIDAQRKGPKQTTELMLDPSDQLIGFRKKFLAWLGACGLPMPSAQAGKALWPEKTTRVALSLLGQALEIEYRHFLGQNKAPVDLQRFDQAVSAAPESYMALDLKAWGLFKNRNYRAAEEVFIRALNANPNGVGAISGLMWCAIRTDNEETAYIWAEAKAKILGESLASGKASAASRMGNAAYKAKDHAKAIELYQKAVTWNPAKRTYVTKLAVAYRAAGQFSRAIDVVEASLDKFLTKEDRRALLINKADSVSSFAASLRKEGKFREAIERLEQALAIDRIYRPSAAVDHLENLASIYDILGDSARASAIRQRSFQIKLKHSKLQ